MIPGLAFSFVIAALAFFAAKLPGLKVIGSLAVALLLAMAVKGAWQPPADWKAGFTYAAKSLLRFGIILLGVRLNLDLILGAGWKILVLDAGVIAFGMLFFAWFSRVCGLEEEMGLLVAIGSAVCGASAIVAATPVVRAREDQSALALVLCTIVGTAFALAFIPVQAALGWTPLHYGAVAGASLHEVAQVLAAVTAVPAALDVGTVTKLVRVLMLAPVILVLLWFRRREKGAPTAVEPKVPFPWFVIGFFVVGVAYSLLLRATGGAVWLKETGGWMLFAGLFLMTMGMAGLGMMVDYSRLRAHGLRAAIAFTAGWFALLAFVLGACRLLGL